METGRKVGRCTTLRGSKATATLGAEASSLLSASGQMQPGQDHQHRLLSPPQSRIDALRVDPHRAGWRVELGRQEGARDLKVDRSG